MCYQSFMFHIVESWHSIKYLQRSRLANGSKKDETCWKRCIIDINSVKALTQTKSLRI